MRETAEVDVLCQRIDSLVESWESFQKGMSSGQRFSDQAAVARSTAHTWQTVVIALGVAVIVASIFLYQSIEDMTKELRILQIHVQDTGAILIREGLAEPEDFIIGPNASGAGASAKE